MRCWQQKWANLPVCMLIPQAASSGMDDTCAEPQTMATCKCWLIAVIRMGRSAVGHQTVATVVDPHWQQLWYIFFKQSLFDTVGVTECNHSSAFCIHPLVNGAGAMARTRSVERKDSPSMTPWRMEDWLTKTVELFQNISQHHAFGLMFFPKNSLYSGTGTTATKPFLRLSKQSCDWGEKS